MTALHERHSTSMQSAPPAGPLNVLWLYCDELRADTLGCYATGPFRPHTPAIDELAASGAVFKECYTNSPICVPSRTALLTGQPPERTGVYHNEAYADGFPLPPGLTTFPEVFAHHGYRTASFGKEHIPAGLTPWQLHDPMRRRHARPAQRPGPGGLRPDGHPEREDGRQPARSPKDSRTAPPKSRRTPPPGSHRPRNPSSYGLPSSSRTLR